MRRFERGDVVEVRVPVVFMGSPGTVSEPTDSTAAFGGPLVWARGVVEEQHPDGRYVIGVLDRSVTRLRHVVVGWASLRWPRGSPP